MDVTFVDFRVAVDFAGDFIGSAMMVSSETFLDRPFVFTTTSADMMILISENPNMCERGFALKIGTQRILRAREDAFAKVSKAMARLEELLVEWPK